MKFKRFVIALSVLVVVMGNSALATQRIASVSKQTFRNQAQSTDVITLGPGDQVAIVAYGRVDLSGRFRVRADGNLSFPLIGSVRASGRTPAEIEKAIANEIVRQTSKAVPLSLEVTEWRPVFAVGYVDKPGMFIFRPGMTALQVLAAAGGIFRSIRQGNQTNLTKDATVLHRTNEQLKSALAEEARLLAELASVRLLSTSMRPSPR